MCSSKDCIRIITANKGVIEKEFGVKSLILFGSVARGDNNKGSDVDLLVDMPPHYVLLYQLKEYLESILCTSVDLIRKHSHMSPSFLTQISNDAIRIF